MQYMPSELSLAAAMIYLLVTVASLIAFQTAISREQVTFHVVFWASIGTFFLVLSVARILGVEEQARDFLRDWISASGLRENRRFFQGLAVSLTIPIFVLMGLYARFHLARLLHSRRNVAVATACLGCGIMLLLILLRLISLHALDRLLFGAPKLNWIFDVGAALLVAAAALYYVGRVRRLI
jgi:hypothetical protein